MPEFNLTKKEREAFSAAFDTLIPEVKNRKENDAFWKRKASDLNIVANFIEIANSFEPEHQKELKDLAKLLCSPLCGITGTYKFKPFAQLDFDKRTQLLQKWSTSSIPLLRKCFSGLKKMAGFIFYGKIVDGKNPNWEAIGYDGPADNSSLNSDYGLKFIKILNSEDLSCDTVIVGSGAGGSVVASVLTKKGASVIVVEKGPYLKPNEMTQQEMPMIRKLYERQGTLASEDGGMGIFAGSCIGGGTTVNWAGSFRTPNYVLHEWATEHQNPHFLDKAYQANFEFIENRTKVNSSYQKHNLQNQSLKNGSELIGLKVKNIPRNIANSDDTEFYNRQGFMGLGDPHHHKQSAIITFLNDACDNGARLLCDTEVTNVVIKNGAAIGINVIQKNNGKTTSCFIKAKKVVVAGGAIHTPAILMRSGLQHSQLGKNLYLHPVMAVMGKYAEKSYPWHGPMMSIVNDSFTQLTGNYGFKIETPPVHPAMMSLAIPWQNGAECKQEMLNAADFATFIVLCRDKYGGSIKLGKRKQPLVHYTLNQFDLNHLLTGLQASCKIHYAAGANEIAILHNNFEKYNRNKGNLAEYIARNIKKKWKPNYFPLLSAHQMGTCRMGGNRKDYPLSPTGQFWGVKNLYVADGSVFPSASGANPMLSIQALANHIATNM